MLTKSFLNLKRLVSLPARTFSPAATTSVSHAVKIQQIDIEADSKSDDVYHLSIPYEAQNLHLQVQMKSAQANHSLGTIAQGIKSLASSVEKVEFQTLDGAIIP